MKVFVLSVLSLWFVFTNCKSSVTDPHSPFLNETQIATLNDFVAFISNLTSTHFTARKGTTAKQLYPKVPKFAPNFENRFLAGDDTCSVIINEINVDDPNKPEKNEFIELKRFCKQGEKLKSLQGFKLVLIQPGTSYSTIEMVVNLWNSKFKETGIFTIGGINVDADLSVSSPLVQYRKKFMGATMTLTSFIKNANRRPLGLALLRGSANIFDLKLDKKHPFLRLNDNLKQLVKSSITDLVVYGRRAFGEHCEIFEYFHEDFAIPTRKAYVLREYDVNLGKDWSLNRCTIQTGGFQPESFKLGHPTPGKENDCSGAHFIFKQVREFSLPLLSVPPQASASSIETPQPCSSYNDPSLYYSLQSHLVDKQIQTDIDMAKFEMCSDMYGANMKTGDHEQTVNKALLKMELMGESTPKPEWQSTSFFQENWLERIKKYQNMILPVALIEKDSTRIWFEYLPNELNPEESKYRCRLCHKYYDAMNFDQRYKPALAKKHGILRKTRKENWETITQHGKFKSHLKVVESLAKRDERGLKRMFEDVQKAEEDKNERLMKVTAKMFRTVFVEVKRNIPLSSHSSLILLQEMNGLEMGFHHYERTSATRIMEFISSQMHTTLINHLLQKQLPLSLIVDSSTDERQKHYLITYFQALEQERPTVYFYKLIPISVGEKAEDLLVSLTQSWKNEDPSIFSHMSRNLVGFASDGAAVMLGKYNGLVKKLENYLDKKLYSVHCMAHRLHLGVRKAMHEVQYYSTFEQTVNTIFNFYNRHGHKRKAHLQQLAKELQLKMFELNAIFEVRWISSEYMALERIKNSWFLLVSDLEAISHDTRFNAETKQAAKGLVNKLTDRTFVITLHFTLDITNELQKWSKFLQERGGMLVGKASFKKSLTNTFTEMKTQNGAYLQHFLHDVTCSDVPGCNVQEYFSSQTVIYQKVPLNINNRQAPSFISVRNNILDKFIDLLDSYFPSGILETFDIFVPSNIPEDDAKIRFYGLSEIITLAKQFQLDSALAVTEWTDLLESILKHDSWCLYRKTDPRIFWPHFLSTSDIRRGEHITHLIHIVLVLPIGSADAERGFSVMNYIRNERRSSLSPVSLDALMRIQLNGPNELERFPSVKYATAWVKSGKMRTDDPNRKKRKTLELKDDDSKIYLESSLF